MAANKLGILIFIILIYSSYVNSNGDNCQTTITHNNDLIDDCNCRISDLHELNNQQLYPLLREIVNKNYFRFFPVNLKKKCQFWQDDGQCSLKSCAVKVCPVDKLPERFRENYNSIKISNGKSDDQSCLNVENNNLTLGQLNKNLSDEQKETIEKWIQFDDAQSDNFCDVDDETSTDMEYIDLQLNIERYTGYTGRSTRRVWSAIYNENCFFLPDSKVYYNLRQKRQNTDKMCLEGRTFYRLISGLHSSISIHLCAQYFFPATGGGFLGLDGRWGPNVDEFKRRFDPQQTDGEGSTWLRNLYFIYLVELRALDKARDHLQTQTYFTGNHTDDAHTKQLINEQFLQKITPFTNHFNENDLFKTGNEQLKFQFKEHFRNISRIMDCVGCDKCKLWGKLQIQALGTALKILYSESSIQLQRAEIVSLINGFAQLSTSIYRLEHTFKSCTKI